MTRTHLSARWKDFVDELDRRRGEISSALDTTSRAALGQFFTPRSVAEFMASMFAVQGKKEISLLDPGAGIGSLSIAVIAELANRPEPPKRICATLYEIDFGLARLLERTMQVCASLCVEFGIALEFQVLRQDFIEAATMACALPFARMPKTDFDCVILNPPYRKINGDSDARKMLSGAGIEVSNLYAGFLALAARLLKQDGELVAITPRSFCNGPYFRAFRRDFFSRMALRRIHVYESRSEAFRDDGVLQENLVFHAIKTHSRSDAVIISRSLSPLDPNLRIWPVPYRDVIHPHDPDMVVHVIADDAGRKAADIAGQLGSTLQDLRLTVSTGRVVDFRARRFLRPTCGTETVPLIYPFNLEAGRVIWPKPHPRKPTAITNEEATADLLVPSETYVVVKRFTAKEERRRLVAALYDPNQVCCPVVGFENHLNYFHMDGRGLPLPLARGLTAFLNSTFADAYFRNLSGHTQVNAQDLRRLKYPCQEQLLLIADKVGEDLADLMAVDRAVEEALDLAYSI